MTQGAVTKKEKKRIVIGINDLFVGGAQNQLVRQLPLYNRDLFEIHIVLLITDKTQLNLIDKVPKHVIVHEMSFTGLSDVRSWIKLYKLMRRLRPDLVVSSLFFSNTVFRMMKPFLHYPIISREHNTYIYKKRYEILIDRILSLWTRKIATVSEEVADFTSNQEKIKREKFVVVNNGINLEEIDEKRLSLNVEETKEALSIEKDERVLLSVGRLVSQKNIEVMIKGFAEFKSKQKNWKLLIVGGGTQEEILKDLVRQLEMEEHIIFEGEKVDTSPYYGISDCLISTSDIEGMSNVQLKAIAYGLPILTTPTGGTGAIISEGENGFIISSPTPSCVAEVITKFANSDSELMKKNALEKRKDFDIKKTVKRYEELFAQYAK